MSNRPAISVVMSAFNAAEYLREAMDSILAQTFKDFEFIIVDNCSTDNTYAIVSSYQDHRIVYIRNEKNLGQTKALNIGLKRSLGEYVARMDADDVSLPNRFELQHSYLKNHSDIAVVGSWCLYIDSFGRPLRFFRFPISPLEIKCNLATSGDSARWSMGHPTTMIRRDILEKEGGYREKESDRQGYPQDYELWSRLIRNYKLANIPKPLLKHRVLNKSQSRGFLESALQSRFEITSEKIRFYLPQMADEDLMPLVRMLEYQLQNSAQEGKKVFKFFDKYFEEFMKEERSLKFVKKYQHQLKFYYLPVLFKTNKLLTLDYFFYFISCYPSLIIDIKFYRKLLKSVLPVIFTQKGYDLLFKEWLSYR